MHWCTLDGIVYIIIVMAGVIILLSRGYILKNLLNSDSVHLQLRIQQMLEYTDINRWIIMPIITLITCTTLSNVHQCF